MTTPQDEKLEFGQGYASQQLMRKGSAMRRMVKSFYVNNVIRHVDGPTVDVGCGAGQILERLPAGSVGIEVNPVLVAGHVARGLDVRTAQLNPARIDLSSLAAKQFNTLVLSHVLEHFADAQSVLKTLLTDAKALGIKKLIIIVPGQVGYRSDATHKTFVTEAYIKANGLTRFEGFELQPTSYFPGNFKALGELFIYHEMMLIYTRPP
jgi:trans-aconitate methyltransferase